MDTKATYRVPSNNVGQLVSKVERANRRAAKLGVEPIRLTLGDTADLQIDDLYAIRVRNVTIEGQAPRIAGWTFVATLQHLGEDGNLVRTIPGVSLPESYRTQNPACDHCNLVRRRNDTYVLQNDAGDLRQVGSNCLQDFVGGLDPHAAAAMAEILQGLNECAEGLRDDDGFDGGIGRNSRVINLVSYLAIVAHSIQQGGWVSRAQARDSFKDGMATADVALSLMFDRSAEAQRERKSARQQYLQEAEDALRWSRETLAAKAELNDYEYNLVVATKQDFVDLRMLGLAASLIPAYRREIEQEIQRKQQAETSRYVGTVGKRETFELTVAGTRTIEGQYGTTTLYRFLDRSGNVLTWFSSGIARYTDEEGLKPAIEVGQTYRIKGTIKKQEEYRGVQQTILTRCKIEGRG